MMFQIKLAGRILRIHHKYKYVKQLCREYLVSELLPFEMEICLEPGQIEEEQQKAEGTGMLSPGYCESLCIYREISLKLLQFDTMLMHAAVIGCDGRGYAFAARSGTGKTTHISLWKQVYGNKITIVNGDKPLLVYDREQELFWAYGTPWCGKENWGVNTAVPLKAICFLERGSENLIRKAETRQILDRLFQQILVPLEEDFLAKQLDLLELLTKKVAFYEMSCNMDREAAITAYKALKVL